MKFSSIVFALSIVAAPTVEAARLVKGSSAERRLKRDSSSSGGSGKSSGSSGDQSANEPDNPCDLCKDGRPESLTFKYLPSDPRIHEFEKHTCGQYTSFPSATTLTVKNKDGEDLGTGEIFDGAEFTINGPFDANSFFHLSGASGLDDGGDSCIIHTSCSDVLLPGYEYRIGPWELIGPECEVQSTDDDCTTQCIICDTNNKQRPDILTMQYLSSGQTSLYQPFDKASCVAGSYPTSTTLTVKDKDGVQQEVISGIVDGSIFSIGNGYDLDSETHFEIAGGSECFIHTSCSVPLVPGDVIGPFKVLEGNDCVICTDPPTMPPTEPATMPPTEPATMAPMMPPTMPPTEVPCIQSNQEVYNCGDPIGVSWNVPNQAYVALPDEVPDQPLPSDWIGIYPCDNIVFFHAEVWKWTCDEESFTSDTCEGLSQGSLVFDSLPTNNQAGPHAWPVAPYVIPANGQINTCFKAVILRNEGPSTPPYLAICESNYFTINAVEGVEGCAVRPDGSPSQSLSHNAP